MGNDGDLAAVAGGHQRVSPVDILQLKAMGDEPVGIDVESFRKFSTGLLDKSMNPAERAEILGSQYPEEAFASFWTRKEAVFKLKGTGITDNLHGILTGNTRTETTVNRSKGYALSVAVFNNRYPFRMRTPVCMEHPMR